MKNKKGFTLIEIIICIGLIVLIGTSSIVGFKIISNKKLITKLDSITDKALIAAQAYIETNDAAYNQLYNNKNGISLPLQLLVNVGLLSLEGTELTEEDIKEQYVVTFLGGTGNSENCEQITSTNSWSNDQPIYLCLNSTGNNSNNSSNKTYIVSNSIYYFTEENPENYAYVEEGNVKMNVYWDRTEETESPFDLNTIADKTRIYAIDRNDDILLAVSLNSTYKKRRYSFKYLNGEIEYTFYSYSITLDNLLKAGYGGKGTTAVWLGEQPYSNSDDVASDYDFILRLSSTCKIKSGTGMSDNPLQITC